RLDSPRPPSLPSYSSRTHLHLHPSPTRRSSDLTCRSTRPTPPTTTRVTTGATSNPRPRAVFPVTPSSVSTTSTPIGPTTTSPPPDRKSTRLNSSHVSISYAVFCLKKKSTRTRPI